MVTGAMRYRAVILARLVSPLHLHEFFKHRHPDAPLCVVNGGFSVECAC